jgi:hypothetical protein
MRTTIARLVVPILFATACGTGASDKGQISDDLKRDLEATAGTRIELANGTSAYQPMRFVSEIEQTESSTPTTRVRSPKRVAARTANHEQDESKTPAPETSQEIQVAEAPSETPESPSPAAEVPTVPSVAPRPAPMIVEYPAAGGSGRGGEGSGAGGDHGVGIGDVIGVIIRGGGVGPDHCPPPRRRGRGPIFR